MEQSCNEYYRRINMVLEYINNNITEPLDIDHLAEVACFSPFHFHRIFTAIMGESIMSYLRRIRLEKSAILLNTRKDESILDIAMECGFSGAAVYNRCFKNYFGISPGEYRKNNPLADEIFKKNCPQHYYSGNIKDIQVKDVEGTYIIYIKCFEGYSSYIYNAFYTLLEYARVNKLADQNTRAIGIPYDSPIITSQNKCRFDACVTVTQPIDTSGKIGCKYIEGGKYVVAASCGDETAIINVYNYLYGEWLPNSRYQPANMPMYHLMEPIKDGEKIIGFDFSVHIPIEGLF